MDSYVIKVIYEDGTPWRFNFSGKEGGDELSLQELQTAIRSKLDLPSTGQIKVNYKDDQGEFVRMTSDEDLTDALIKQALNPLILKVKFVESPPPPGDPRHAKAPMRWGWGSTLITKMHSETSASEAVADATYNVNGIEKRGSEHLHDCEVSLSSSLQLVDYDQTQSVCDTMSNSGLDEEPGGNLPPSPAPKVVRFKCYECGMNPIVGPWYMSIPIRKQPYASCIYHLCEDCFVLRSWRHSKSIQFKLIKECAECHQYKPDVRGYPFQGNNTTQSGEEASDDILLCDWCFKGITHMAMDIENRSMSQTLKDTGSTGRSRKESPVSTEPIQMSQLLPAN